MGARLKMFVPGVMILVVMLLLAACASTDGSAAQQQTGSSATARSSAPASTPEIITPVSVQGSAGQGPKVVATPTLVAGGNPGSQQIALGDRTLFISSVVKQKGPQSNTSLINLNLAIQNTSAKVIKNLADFFQLLSTEGDVFGSQYNSTDTFYGPIAANTTRSGTITFEVPAAAAQGLRLLYRPEIATETAIILLKVA